MPLRLPLPSVGRRAECKEGLLDQQPRTDLDSLADRARSAQSPRPSLSAHPVHRSLRASPFARLFSPQPPAPCPHALARSHLAFPQAPLKTIFAQEMPQWAASQTCSYTPGTRLRPPWRTTPSAGAAARDEAAPSPTINRQLANDRYVAQSDQPGGPNSSWWTDSAAAPQSV